MESEIDDGKSKDTIYHYQENNNKLDESVKTQINEGVSNEPAKAQLIEGNSRPMEGNPNEPLKSLPDDGEFNGPANSHCIEGKVDEPADSMPNEGKLDEPEGLCEEKPDSDKTLQDIGIQEQSLGALDTKENLGGKRKKRKLMLEKKKTNVSNGKVAQNKLNIVKPMVQQRKAEFTKPEVSSHEKNLEIVPMVDQQSKGETDVPDGTDQIRTKGINIGDMTKGDTNKKRKKRAKKGKGNVMEKLKQKMGEASGNMNSEKKIGKLSSPDKGTRHDKSKDKLGGLIFMCSSKTKPDCFRYSVMGVPLNKKDLVLSIKPGLKLFLYDFELKLLYGVYRATSLGGMKLEPAAYGGAFPFQVKFEVFKDCYPLPESVFRKAIKENYNEKRKFKTELTFEQVKKLSTLFRTVGVGSKAPTHSSPAKRVEDTKIFIRDMEHQTHSSRAWSNRDDQTYADYGSKARKDESSRDSFHSEREYQTYGLHGRRRSRSPPRLASLVPRLDHERDVHLRYPPVYGDATTIIRHERLLMGRSDSRPYSLERQRDMPSSIHPEPTVFEGRRYLTYEPISLLDYQSHLPPTVRQTSGLESNRHYMPPSYNFPDDPYSSSIRRDEQGAGPYYSLDGRRVVFLPETNISRRREPEVAACDHTLGYTYQEASRRDPSYAPVSSRYSFAGPSSYR